MSRIIIAAVAAILAVVALIIGIKPIKKDDTIETSDTETVDSTVPEILSSDLLSQPDDLTEAPVAVTIPDTQPGTTAAPAVTEKEKTTKPGTTAPAQSTTKAAETTSKAATTAAQSDYEYSYAGFNPQLADLNVEDWRLILVNRDYILPEGFEPEKLVPSVEGDPDSKLLDYRVAPYYNKMYLAARKDGIELTTVSGYRSYDRQRTNFENKIKKYMNQGMSKVEATQEAATIILPPGTSEHNLGFAMDICSLEQSFENTKAFKWLCENAEDYGFILRYRKEKQDVTKIIYEPWHWRYVGVENAKKINASGLCLEEYLGKV